MGLVDQKIAAWCGVIFSLLFGVGLFIAGFLPMPAQSMSATEVAAFIKSDTTRIRVGMLIMVQAGALFLPFTAVISHQMLRMQGISTAPVFTQIIAGALNAMTVLLSPVIYAATALRPDRDPDALYAMWDIGWFVLIPLGSPAQIQNLAIALAIFLDKRETPIFPRWFGYMTLLQVLTLWTTELPIFFQTGIFAWNGIVGFYFPATFWFIWLLTMVWLLLRAIESESRELAQNPDLPRSGIFRRAA